MGKFLYPLIIAVYLLGLSAHSLDLSYEAKISNLRVKTVTAKGIYLVHGALGALNPITGITGNAMEHWWLEIETEKSDEWYILQFGGKRKDDRKHLELKRYWNRTDVDNRGKCFRDNDPDIFTLNSFQANNITMGQVYTWASDVAPYKLISHNCQDLVNQFFAHFNHSWAYDPEKITWETADHVLTAAVVVETIVSCNLQ